MEVLKSWYLNSKCVLYNPDSNCKFYIKHCTCSPWELLIYTMIEFVYIPENWSVL